jgi:sortase A
MKLKKIGLILVIIGSLIVIASAALWMRNYFEEHSAARNSEDITVKFFSWVYGSAQNNDFYDYAQTGSRLIEIDGAMYIGVISIPALDLNLAVNNTWSNAALKNTPCRYSGSIYDNTLVIGAHNYSSHFGKFSSLLRGSQVVFLCADGIEHFFEVVSVETVHPSSRDSVVYSDYDLTMFTCTFDGQERIAVRCKRTAE